MDQPQRTVLKQTLLITLACIAGSVSITLMVTYLASASWDAGIGLYIAILAPALLVPLGSYSHISLAARLKEANDQLRTLAQTDPLTGTCNRRHFLDTAQGQLALARRHCFPTTVLLIDFDHFKAINDAFGHLAGDRVLVDASQVIGSMLRDSDTLARFGGEEFIALLPHTAREGAQMVAQRIMSAIREREFRHDGQAIGVTVSIGGVTCETSESSLERLTSMADSLMYEAKQAGRDCCTIETLPRQSVLPFRDTRLS